MKTKRQTRKVKVTQSRTASCIRCHQECFTGSHLKHHHCVPTDVVTVKAVVTLPVKAIRVRKKAVA